jgi:hypothetical protein
MTILQDKTPSVIADGVLSLLSNIIYQVIGMNYLILCTGV